jgi:hypothetical protein
MCRKLLLIPSIALLIVAGLYGVSLRAQGPPRTPNKRINPFLPHDTPIIITGGSIKVKAVKNWDAAKDGSYSASIPARVARISVVNKDKAGKERHHVTTQGHAWVITLTNASGEQVTFSSGPSANMTIAATVSTGRGKWQRSLLKKQISFQNHDTKIDHIDVRVYASDNPSSAYTDDGAIPCMTASDPDATKRGRCVIHLRTVDSPLKP